jgi:SPP1 gp7 family putative phage head morphogenesis protein
VKRPKRPKVKGPPMGVAMRYMALLRRWVDTFHDAVWKYLEANWPQNSTVFPGGRADAASAWVKRSLGDLDLVLEETLGDEELGASLDALADQVSLEGSREFRRLVGISLTSEAGISAAVQAFRARNVGLIKSLAGQELEEIRGLLGKAEAGAWRVEELRKEILGRFDVTRSKADLLARDQVLKLNGQLAQVRQQNAGITEYVWSTSGDERVREFHQDLDGTTQRWDSPPVVSEDGRTGHPGDDYQCRCVAVPILPELDPGAV